MPVLANNWAIYDQIITCWQLEKHQMYSSL